jgi:hypothetical protein
VTRDVTCNFCLGDGHVSCECYSGECQACKGQKSKKCSECEGSRRCKTCSGTGKLDCKGCQGKRHLDPRILWWTTFERNCQTGDVDALLHDHETTLSLIPKKYRACAVSYMEGYLGRNGFPANTLQKLLAFSRSLL